MPFESLFKNKSSKENSKLDHWSNTLAAILGTTAMALSTGFGNVDPVNAAELDGGE